MLSIAILIALAAGAANPFQTGVNAELNKQLQQPALAGVWVYLSGLAGLLLMGLALRQFSAAHLGRLAAAFPQVPWWAWMGGLISIGSTMAGLLFAQRLGSGVFTGLSVTGLSAAHGRSRTSAWLWAARRRSLAGLPFLGNVPPAWSLRTEVAAGPRFAILRQLFAAPFRARPPVRSALARAYRRSWVSQGQIAQW